MIQVLPATVSTKVNAGYNFPSVAIIMPFEPKMKYKRELSSALNEAVDKVERKLFDGFCSDMALLVMQKLSVIIKELNFSTHKKSLAIFVSPVFEKVLYLNMEVEENVLVSQSFNIRELVKSKKQIRQYLVLQITGKECRLYANEQEGIKKIFSYSIQTVSNNSALLPGDLPVNRDNQLCETCQTKNFLHYIDNTLDFIMNSYQLPLFVIGEGVITKQFIIITKHINSVIEEVQSDYEEEDMEEIKKLVMPYTTEWQKVYQKFIAGQLKTAVSANKCVSGVTNVFESAMHHNGRLLLVEENFQYPATYTKPEEMIYKATRPHSRFSFVNDAVDEIIEKVLDAGADVEFVSEKIMKHHDHIALIL